MTHEMFLHGEPFHMIRKNKKTIELRLNDEKRQLIKSGDYIIFIHHANHKKIITSVLNIHKFDTFDDLYQSLPLDKCGYGLDELENAKSEDMLIYYSKEKQSHYGVLGIELELINMNDCLSITDMTSEYYEMKASVHHQSWVETYTDIMN